MHTGKITIKWSCSFFNHHSRWNQTISICFLSQNREKTQRQPITTIKKVSLIPSTTILLKYTSFFIVFF